jgi:hypothetical protein
MEYREFIKNLDKKIYKWNYAIPLGVVAYVVSNLLGGASTTIGAAVGVFNLLIIVGIITGIIDLIRYFKNKNMEREDTTIEKKEGFNSSPIIGAILVIGLLYFVFGHSSSTNSPNTDSAQQNANNYWIVFDSPDGDFSISLPSNPEHKVYEFPASDSTSAYTQDQYMSKKSGQAFLISRVLYTSVIDTSDSKNFLNTSLKGMLGTDSGNSLVSSEFVDFKNNHSLDFLMETKSFGTFIKGKLILAGQKIYLLGVESEIATPENYDRFVNSFEVK